MASEAIKARAPICTTIDSDHVSDTEPKRRIESFQFPELLLIINSVLISLLSYYLVHFRSLITPDHIQQKISSWTGPTSKASNTTQYPNFSSSDIVPIPCHSHNDEWRQIPLYDALAAGCISVEADTWLKDNELYVGHSENSLTPARTLRNLYIDPLVQILTHQNQAPLISNLTNTSPSTKQYGIFDSDPSLPLKLLIDMKTNGTETYPALLTHLEPLRSRGWLTYFNGSAVIPGLITVVGSGNTPFDLLVSNTTYRDVFFDAPLDQLWGEEAPNNATAYTAENSYYASVSFDVTIGKPWLGQLLPEQVRKIRGQVAMAKDRGLVSRYWDTPAWPVATREHVWDVLEKEGVGMLNIDDLEAASQRKWG